MEDVTARIIVTAESSMAVQGLNNVRKALDDVSEARMKELQLEKARAQLELAEFESSQAAQKAYAAEIPLRGAERQLESLKEQHQAHIEMYKVKKQLGELDGKQNNKWVRSLKKEAAEIDNLKGKVQELTKAYLPLANAEASANLAAFNAKQKMDSLSVSTKKAAAETQKFSWKMAAARAASRMFSMDLGATSSNMIKYGIIAAGAASAVKLVKWGLEKYDEAMMENGEQWRQNHEDMKETASAWAEQRQKQNDALESLRQYNQQGELSKSDSRKMLEAIKTMKHGFSDLSVEVDETTGRIKNFAMLEIEYQEKQSNKKIAEYDAQIWTLKNAIKAQEEIRDHAGWAVFGGGIRFGGREEMKAAGEEIKSFKKELARVENLRSQERKINYDKKKNDLRWNEYEDLIEAKTKLEKRQEVMWQEVKIINLRNQGLEREAKLLELNMKYDKERAGLQNEIDRKAFDSQRHLLINAELAKWEAERKRDDAPKKEERRSVFQDSLSGELFKYRSMAQSAIDANSAEGWRLQTRRLTSADMGDPQKSSAESLKTVVKQGAETNQKLENLTRQVAALTSGGAKITVAARKY